MFEIRIHGRGGQGVVTAAELLSAAVFAEGKYAQAFPSFGSERTGAPVVSYCRIDDKPIRVREPVMHPDVLIIQDPTLLHQVNVFDGAGDARAAADQLRAPGRRPRHRGLHQRSAAWRRHHGARHRARSAARRAAGAQRGAARRLRGADRCGLARLRPGRHHRPVHRVPSARATPPPPRRLRPRPSSSWASPAADGRPVAGARRQQAAPRQARRGPRRPDRRLARRGRRGRPVPPGGHLRLPDLAADPHRRGTRHPGEGRRSRSVRVRQRRVGVRGDVGGDRRVSGGRARLHRDGQPGPAVHGRGAVQRLRARACRS